jgi:hypothetical protein
MAAALLARGADPSRANHAGRTPPQLHWDDGERALVAFWRAQGVPLPELPDSDDEDAPWGDGSSDGDDDGEGEGEDDEGEGEGGEGGEGAEDVAEGADD